MLLDDQGRLELSSNQADERLYGERIQLPGIAEALRPGGSANHSYSQPSQAEIVDVSFPIRDPDRRLVGFVRLTYHLSDVYERTLNVRYIILAVRTIGLALGVIAGWSLPLRLGNPIRRIAQAVCQIAQGGLSREIPEEGPEEIHQLANAVNTLVNRTHDLEKERKQILANLVYELGRPLGALHAATHALQSGADQDPDLRRELLKGMDEEIRRLQRLLEDLAHLNDQSIGALELKPQVTPLDEWLLNLLPPWRQAAQDERLHWKVDLGHGLPELYVDPDRLALAVGNLIRNAIR